MREREREPQRTLSFSNASLTGRSDRTTAEVGADGGGGGGDGFDSAIAPWDNAYPVNAWPRPEGGLLTKMKRESEGRVGRPMALVDGRYLQLSKN
jgi:hypothetical protein